MKTASNKPSAKSADAWEAIDVTLAHVQDSQATPRASVIRVRGRPTRRYSQKLTVTPWRRAFSATIRLATEPSNVRFPARVLDMASASHALSCDPMGIAGMIGLNSSTAG